MRFRCPKCKKDTALWRGVELSGWQGLEPDLTRNSEREAYWECAHFDGTFGCGECGWEGRDLERLSEIDGKPLVTLHPRQDALPV